jgi:hypothetical protein
MADDFWRRFRDAFFHRGPSYQPWLLPHRGAAVHHWLVACRDQYDRDSPQWQALDAATADYERHADTRTPLHQPIPEES